MTPQIQVQIQKQLFSHLVVIINDDLLVLGGELAEKGAPGPLYADPAALGGCKAMQCQLGGCSSRKLHINHLVVIDVIIAERHSGRRVFPERLQLYFLLEGIGDGRNGH